VAPENAELLPAVSVPDARRPVDGSVDLEDDGGTPRGDLDVLARIRDEDGLSTGRPVYELAALASVPSATCQTTWYGSRAVSNACSRASS
jgi:hypothetical protein